MRAWQCYVGFYLLVGSGDDGQKNGDVFFDNDLGSDDKKAAAADDDGVDVCDFDNNDDEDDDIVYLLQGSVYKFRLHASVNAPLVPDEAQSSFFLFFSPLSLLNSVHKFDES